MTRDPLAEALGITPGRPANEPPPMAEVLPAGPGANGQRPAEPADEPVILPGIPDYPAGDLCGPLANLVASTALPSALVGGGGLAALSAACGPADLIMPDGSRQYPNLWLPLIGPRGVGKTPALLNVALDRLRRLDLDSYDQYQVEAEQWNKGNVAPGADPPRDGSILLGDITLEALFRLLGGGGSYAVVADELRGWLESMGQYKRVSADRDKWAELWSGGPVRYTRVGADRSGDVGINKYARRPVVTVVGGLQPHLHGLLGDPESGFRARWLPHLVAAPDQPPEWGPRLCGTGKWDDACTALYALLRTPRDWQLAGPAATMWADAAAAWKRAARGPVSPSAAAALDKADIQCARIALVLSESVSPGAAQDINPDAMACAIALTSYVMGCWAALPEHETLALSPRDEKLARAADTLTAWLEARTGRQAKGSEIAQAHVAGVRTAGDLAVLLEYYQRMYPGTVETAEPGPRGGRPGRLVRAPRRQPATGRDQPGSLAPKGRYSSHTADEIPGQTALPYCWKTRTEVPSQV